VDPIFHLANEADTDLLLGMMREYYAYDGHAPVPPCSISFAPSFGRPWLICDPDIAVGYIVLTFGYSLECLGRDAFIDDSSFVLRIVAGVGGGLRSTLLKMLPAPRKSVPSIWKSSVQIQEPKRFISTAATPIGATTSCRNGLSAASPNPARDAI